MVPISTVNTKIRLERFSLDCRIGIGFGFGFGFTTSFGWLVYLLWFWFYDSQVKTALTMLCLSGFELYSRWVPL